MYSELVNMSVRDTSNIAGKWAILGVLEHTQKGHSAGETAGAVTVFCLFDLKRVMESAFLTFVLLSLFAVYSSHLGITGMKCFLQFFFSLQLPVKAGANISQLWMSLLECKPMMSHAWTEFSYVTSGYKESLFFACACVVIQIPFPRWFQCEIKIHSASECIWG